MITFNKKDHVMIFFTLLLTTSLHAKVHVRVTNGLDNNRVMTVHCQSRDDDIGYHVLEEGSAIGWSFNPNIWVTTLFYCDVKMGDSNIWYHFDAYDARRDYYRCWTMCRWIITNEGSLYGFDEESGSWEWFPFSAFE
ncbi:hypothetical protein ACJIZ3_012134 [Penstemon smallii]|uniref:S-protein homolog n=1 Tax=Penstemon smallii TaxID=265156 RepID=A0ABD3UPQ9_9LAMI